MKLSPCCNTKIIEATNPPHDYICSKCCCVQLASNYFVFYKKLAEIKGKFVATGEGNMIVTHEDFLEFPLRVMEEIIASNLRVPKVIIVNFIKL